MKKVASMACVAWALAGCATGSTPANDLYDDAGSDAATVFIVGPATDSGSTATTAPSSGGAQNGNGTSTTPPGTPDAGGDDFGSGDDAGFGGFDASFGDDDSSFGDDSGYGDDDSSYGDDDASYGDDDSGYGDDSGGGSGSTCDGYASPDTTAGCTCTANDQSECQANGCYNGYYCDTNTNKCKSSAPSGC